MRDQTIRAVTTLLGEPSSSTDKVLRWNVKPGLDVVVQRDGSSERGVVWMPWPCGRIACPRFGEVYPASRGRHSNTYGAPSLTRGKAALKIVVENATALGVLRTHLTSVLGTQGAAAAKGAIAEISPASPSSSRRARRTPSPQASRAVAKRVAPPPATDEVTGLVIKSPWVDLILKGEKTWEVRTSHASKRGRIALIQSKSGRIVGTCRVMDCLGPLTMEQMLANADKHRVPAEELDQYCRPGKTYAWVLADPQPFAQPIPYQHPSGAVIWVRLTRGNVPHRFDELAAAAAAIGQAGGKARTSSSHPPKTRPLAVKNVSLKVFRFMSDRYVGKLVRLSDATFFNAESEIIDSKAFLRLSLTDVSDNLFRRVYADRAKFAAQVLGLSTDDAVEIVGRVERDEDDADGDARVVVSQIRRLSSADDDDDDDDDDDEVDDDAAASTDSSEALSAGELVAEEDGEGAHDALDITDRVERLEAFEERMGVRLVALSAFLEDRHLTVRGELQARNGTEMAHDVELVLAAYDPSARVIGTTSRVFAADDFFGIETFELRAPLPLPDVERVRIYARKS